MGKTSLKEINDERNRKLKQHEQQELLNELVAHAKNSALISTVEGRLFSNWLTRWGEVAITGRAPTTLPFSTHHE